MLCVQNAELFNVKKKVVHTVSTVSEKWHCLTNNSKEKTKPKTSITFNIPRIASPSHLNACSCM